MEEVSTDNYYNYYPSTIVEKYTFPVLNSVKNVKCEGSFGYNEENGFAFMSVSADFAKKSYKVPNFPVRYTIRKNKFPG